MRIGAIGGPSIGPAARRARSEHVEPEIETRALIAVEEPVRSERAPAMTRYPAAAFLAQLIATQMHAPQTRARRRAEPGVASAVYRSRPAAGAARVHLRLQA